MGSAEVRASVLLADRGAPPPVVEHARYVIAADGDTATVTADAALRLSGGDLVAWIQELPSTARNAPRLVESAALARLDALTAPRLLEEQAADPCRAVVGRRDGRGAARAAVAAVEAPRVSLVASATAVDPGLPALAPREIFVAESIAALRASLRQRGFELPADASIDAAARGYLVSIAAVGRGASGGAARFPSWTLALAAGGAPLALPLPAPSTVVLLADAAALAPRDAVRVPSGYDWPRAEAPRFARRYGEITAALAMHRPEVTAWLEFAGDVTACADCPGPQPSAGEWASLGAPWTAPAPSKGKSVLRSAQGRETAPQPRVLAARWRTATRVLAPSKASATTDVLTTYATQAPYAGRASCPAAEAAAKELEGRDARAAETLRALLKGDSPAVTPAASSAPPQRPASGPARAPGSR